MRVGMWLSSTDPQIGAALLGTELDVVVADRQHAFVSEELVFTLRSAVRADGPALWVRVPRLDYADIGKALDAGASGVVVPLVSTPEQARQAAQACALPPSGTRSFGPLVAPAHEIECVVMIETGLGVDNAAQIAAVPGVTGVLIGLADLALDLGFAVADASLGDGPLSASLETVLAACRAAGVPCGVGASAWSDAARAAELGFDLVLAGGEKGLLRSAVATQLTDLRAR